MSVFAKDPVYERENDCRPIGMLLHRFLPQPVPRQANAIVALELVDVAIREKFVQLGQPGYCPPWPQVEDIMYCRMNWENPTKVEIVVIRDVILPLHLREGTGHNGQENVDDNEPYVEHVWVSLLLTQNRARGEYRAVRERTLCSWTCLLGHVEDCGIVIQRGRGDRDEHIPTH